MKKTIWLLFLFMCPFVLRAVPAGKIPILLDTDIGTDIDDAFALALIVRSPELELLGVTTVSGDTQARAKLAAKLLWESGFRRVPVVAGAPGKPLPIEQTRWAKDFKSPQLQRGSAVDFLGATLRRRVGKTTIVAIGPLTNIAALLHKDPGIAKKIDQIVLMGGSIHHGYGKDPTPVAEYNIASDPAAAQAVFSSGVHILMVPLDVTAMLQLHAADRHRVFITLSPMSDALAILYNLWDQRTPTLFDPMAVAILVDASLCQTQLLNVKVDTNGFTHVADNQPPNATVALQTDPAKFFEFYLGRVAPVPNQ
ncbi:MAG: nucleoside hydrolase [Acidobacteria bacterium]|nr:MAG: nucleoside hydrolase [Acidobacteriota bacterium]